MIRVQVTVSPLRLAARARIARRMLPTMRAPLLCGLCLGLAATLATHKAPAPLIVRYVRAPVETAPAPVTAPSQADIELDAFCTSFLANARAVGVSTAAQGADVLRCQRRTYRIKPQ